MRIVTPNPHIATAEVAGGIRTLHIETRSITAGCAVMVQLGSRDDPKGLEGLTHLFEHMLFKGTERRSAFQVTNRIESVGGELNAYTAKEELVIQATLLADDINRALELLADITLRSTFPERELQKEREVILEEIASYSDAPSEQIYDDFETHLYGNHPLGHNILGSAHSVRRIKTSHLHDLAARYLRRERIVVATYGPFTPALSQRLIERHFADLPSGARPFPRTPATHLAAHTGWKKRHTAQLHCIMGGIGLPLGSPDSAPLAMMLNIFAGGASNARLNLALRERTGLVYQLDGSQTAYTDTGLFSIYFGTEKKALARALSIAQAETKRLKEQPLGTLQMRMAARQYEKQLVMATEAAESLMLLNARRSLEGLPPTSIPEMIKSLEGITPASIQEAANRYLDEQNTYTTLYW